jgi:hypothetical protein
MVIRINIRQFWGLRVEHRKASGEVTRMSISRKLGILVFFGVPAIIGGGITYHLFDGNYVPVFIYETLLLSIAGAYLSK